MYLQRSLYRIEINLIFNF